MWNEVLGELYACYSKFFYLGGLVRENMNSRQFEKGVLHMANRCYLCQEDKENH